MPESDPTGPYEVVCDDRPFAPGPWPALVDVHGGAWTYFDRTADAYSTGALAACGLVVVALDFRTGPGTATPPPSNRADRRLERRPPDRAAALRPDAPEFATTPVDAAPDAIPSSSPNA